MSQQTLGLIIEALLTDQNLRVRLELEPLDTLAELVLRGFELTSDDIDALMQTRSWSWNDEMGFRFH